MCYAFRDFGGEDDIVENIYTEYDEEFEEYEWSGQTRVRATSLVALGRYYVLYIFDEHLLIKRS